MWIEELICENWRGQNFHDQYKEHEVKISGKNASGKSTRSAAIFWLLTSYADANSPANHKLFNDKVELTPQTPVASVTAVLNFDGERYKVRREATASFQRKRGTSEYVKSASDSYKFFVDDVERSSTDFKDWLSAHIAVEDMIKYALDGSFFINLVFDDKKKARTLIEKVVGEVLPEEMKGDYSLIADLMLKYSLEEIDARATNMAKGINQRLTEIPSLIQSMEHEISEIEQFDFKANDAEIARLESEREACDKQMLDLTERMKPQMEARAKAVADRQMKVTVFEEAYRKWCNEPQEEIARLTSEINAIRRQNEESKRKYDAAVTFRESKTTERDNAIQALKNAELKRERLLADRDAELNAQMDPNSAICPNCGAQLTGDKLQAVINKFEAIKREKVNAIVVEGKATAAEIERLNKVILDAQPYIDAELPAVINQPTTELETKIANLTGRSMSKEVFAATELGKRLQDEIDAIVIPEVKMPDDTAIKTKKDEINQTLVPLYEKRGLRSRADKLRTDIESLRNEQREKGAELALYERQRQLVKDYKQEQMEILSHKVNDGLKFSRIECWSTQKDGTVVPDLVLKDSQGVSFACTNNASRIVTTVDIQRFFCEKLHVNMPVFVDECSILDQENLPTIPGTQMFYLFRADTSINVESK